MTTSPALGRVRRTWLVAGSIVAVLTLGWGTVQAVTVLAHEEQTVTSTFSASSVAVVDVDVEFGELRIVAAPVDSVQVTAHVSRGLAPTNHTEDLDGDRLVLRSSCPGPLSSFCSVDYTVEVPAGVSVVARTDDGDIEVRGIDGVVDARSGDGRVSVTGGRSDEVRGASENGSVRLTDLRATTVEAVSGNGSVEVAVLYPPDAVRARSENGDVSVVLPDTGAAYSVDAESANGSRAIGVRTDPTSNRSIFARSGEGDVTVTYPSR